MLCPECGSYKTQVTDSRSRNREGLDYGHVRRRRNCFDCKYKFTTYETLVRPGTYDGSKARKTLDKIKHFLEIELLE